MRLIFYMAGGSYSLYFFVDIFTVMRHSFKKTFKSLNDFKVSHVDFEPYLKLSVKLIWGPSSPFLVNFLKVIVFSYERIRVFKKVQVFY